MKTQCTRTCDVASPRTTQRRESVHMKMDYIKQSDDTLHDPKPNKSNVHPTEGRA